MDIVRARTYGRQSHKSENDSQASPIMQRDTGISYINSQDGWQHTGHYEDVGLSGYDPNVFRPDFEQMMADARERKFDVLVIYMLSRLTRQGAAEALAISTELAKYGVALVSTQEPFINTSNDNPFGVAFFALVAGLAHQESRNKSKFIRDAFAELRAKGSHSSGPVPFGFRAEAVQVDKVTIRRLHPQPEGHIGGDTVRRAIGLAFAGLVPNAIADKLTADGIPTPLQSLGEAGEARRAWARTKRKSTADDAPAEWSTTTVLRMLRDPRLAGFAIGPVDPKTRRRPILRDETEQPVRPHEGFISAQDWYRLQQILDGRKREKSHDRTGNRTLLGSWGLLHCGKCGAAMTRSTAQGGGYLCNLRRAVNDVPRHVLRIDQRAADAVVARGVWLRLADLNPETSAEDGELLLAAAERFAAAAADPEATAELAEQEAHLEHVQESLTQLYADRSDGLYEGPTGRRTFGDTVRKYQAYEVATMARIDELRAGATAAVRVPLSDWLPDAGDDPIGEGSLWAGWGIEEQRAFLALWIDSVRVLSATGKGRASIARNRIEIDWAQRTPGEVADDEQATV